MAFIHENDHFDCTGDIGPLFPGKTQPTVPMYSFERPAWKLWNAIGAQLHARGWTEEQIRWWFQSKATRWHLDGDLGAAIEAFGKLYADRVNVEDRTWVQDNMEGGQ